MDVRTDLKARDQVGDVLNYFNVRVTSRDIFSRCHVCNGNSYVQIIQNDMKRLWLEAHLARASFGLKRQEADHHQHQEERIPSGALPPPIDKQKMSSGASINDSGRISSEALPRPIYSERMSSGAPPPLIDSDDDDDFEVAGDCNYDEEFVYVGPVASASPQYKQEDEEEDEILEEEEGLEEAAGIGEKQNQKLVHIYDPDLLRTDLSIDFKNTKLSNDVIIQTEAIPEGVLNHIGVFYVCSQCGKVFWAGGHYQRITEQFGHLIHKV